MRQVGEDLEAEIEIDDAVIDDPEIEIARSGGEPQKSVTQIEYAEIEQELA